MRRASAEKANNPGVRSTRPAGRQTFPRYVAIGNAKKVDHTLDVCDYIPERHRGRVFLDIGGDGELIGIEIIG